MEVNALPSYIVMQVQVHARGLDAPQLQLCQELVYPLSRPGFRRFLSVGLRLKTLVAAVGLEPTTYGL